MRFRTVLFDFDGTLIDSGATILESFHYATRTVLDREFSDEQVLAMVGTPLHLQMRGLDPDRADELVEAFRRYGEPLNARLLAFDGVADLLEHLQGEGHRLGIVTSKRRLTIDMALESIPIEHYFDVIVTSDDTERHKPNPEPVLLALERLGARAEDAVYVGDAPFDIRAGKQAGVATVAITWGKIHDRARLEAESPDEIVDTPAELLDVL